MADKSTQNKDDIAVIKTGGKQYIVQEGDVLRIEKIKGKEVGDTIEFDTVLLSDDGSDTKVASDVSSTVKAKITEQGRGEKIEVIRFKAKSRYTRRKGHRQEYMEVEITSL